MATLPGEEDRNHGPGLLPSRNILVGIMAFLTVVDLFAAQAVLPSLRDRYGVTPAAMAVAVNASTIGMAVTGIITALIARHIARRSGIALSLVLLAVPTLLLAHAPDLATFTALRIAQGCCMATAFTLSLAWLGESAMSPQQAAGAFAAYVTGNVASNLVGRIFSSGLTDLFGLSLTFYAFAGLNLAGAVMAVLLIPGGSVITQKATQGSTAGPFAVLREPRLLATFAIGFCILFAFIGVFTFVNYVLAAPPFSIGPMSIGAVYLVFAPSIVTTPLAGRAVARFGTPSVVIASLTLAGFGVPLLAAPYLVAILPGLALVAIGTFAAQAAATGFVGRAASGDRALASGFYLASYFAGGLVGTALLGRLFDGIGWHACLAGVAAALGLAACLAPLLRDRS